jgi:methionyl aminopeptidase
MQPKTDIEIAAMRKSGYILGSVLEKIRRDVRAGMTPKQVSVLAAAETARLGGKPAFRGFEGFPDIICISNNNEVQHSIPNDRPFRNGDIVNFDYGVVYERMITDAGITVCIGGQQRGNNYPSGSTPGPMMSAMACAAPSIVPGFSGGVCPQNCRY